MGVSDVAAAIAFYADILGFTCFVAEGGYAYVERDRVDNWLLELDDCTPHPVGASHSYIDLLDVDGIFAELKPKLAALPADQWRKPKDRHYGQREFWVRDPDGNLITFGKGVGANVSQWNYRA